MEWSKKAVRQFIIICVLFTFGSTYLIIDYYSLPNETSLMWEGEFKYVTDRTYSDPQKTFKIGLGDGFISNIEIIFIHLSLIFGCFECIDFVFCFEPKRKCDARKYLSKKYKERKTKKDKEK